MNQLFNLMPNGEDFIKGNCPEIYRLLQMKPALHTRAVCAMNLNNEGGFQDTTEIQDICFDKENKILRAKSVAGFSEKKGVIAIVSEVINSVTGESIKGAAVTTKDAYSLLCNIDSELKNHSLSNDSHFLVRTVFYWTETDANGEVIMKSHEERKNSGVLYDGETDIVENITVEFPNTLKPRDYTIVLYNRTAESNVEDPDKVYDNIKVKNNRLPFYLPFIGSVKLGKGTIIGVDKEASIIKIQHPEKQTNVTFNKDKGNNWKDIKWEYQNENKILHCTFPEDWKNELDLKDLSVNSIFDFYACLTLKVKIDSIELPINIYMGSNIEEDNTHCKVKKVFLQWGCLGKETHVMMANGSYKVICEIKIGDLVNTGKGCARVSNIYTGNELEIINLMTENGKKILMTEGHPVMTERGWVRAGNLHAADKIITAEGRKETLQGLFFTYYGDKVYNLELDGEEHQLIAEGIVVGDFTQQNSMLGEEKADKTSIKGQEELASEFQTLVEEINRNMNRKE